MNEKIIEKYLYGQVRGMLNGEAYKFSSPGRRAVPDRLCVVGGWVFFVECKAPGKILTPAQEREAQKLKDLNQWVYAVNSKYEIDKIISFWRDKLREEGAL